VIGFRNDRRTSALPDRTNRWLTLAAVAIALVGVFALRAQAPDAKISPSSSSPAQILTLRIGDEIEPVMAEYVDNGIEEAARRHASLILITMDTPGGLSTSMEDIIHLQARAGLPRAFLFWSPRISPRWLRERTPALRRHFSRSAECRCKWTRH
jgi:membrane-bound serine protease (ClpP class)